MDGVQQVSGRDVPGYDRVSELAAAGLSILGLGMTIAGMIGAVKTYREPYWQGGSEDMIRKCGRACGDATLVVPPAPWHDFWVRDIWIGLVVLVGFAALWFYIHVKRNY